MKFEATVSDRTFELEFDEELTSVEVKGNRRPFTFQKLSEGQYLLRIDLKTYVLDNVTISDNTVEFTLNNKWQKVDIKDEQAILLEQMGFRDVSTDRKDNLLAPMPGKILSVLVNEGDTVKIGDPLIILEAMKMENELKAPISGTVTSVRVETGKSVNKKEILIEIKAIG